VLLLPASPSLRTAAPSAGCLCAASTGASAASSLYLGSKDTLVGAVTVTQVQDKFSIGAFAGEGTLKRGDLLKFQ